MPFLRGSLGFERFDVAGFDAHTFGDEHIEMLSKHVAGRSESSASENVHVGFLGGDHLFDQEFDLVKNVIDDAVHCSVRVDTNQVPAAIRAAWLQLELSGLAKDSSSGKPTKAQRKEAKEAVEQRCEVAAASGKYRRMQQFPLLWDYQNCTLYFGGSIGTSSAFCTDLLERTFDLELRRIGAGTIATNWAIENDRFDQLDDLTPANFVKNVSFLTLPWMNEHSQSPDYLGNEFLMWLWWKLETDSDTFELPDESELSVMLSKTLTLECPLSESGKETITAESPVALPEATQAIRSGKLPRKTGMTIVRDGRTMDLVLQAETFAISGAKIHLDDDEEFEQEDRIEAIRTMSESVDLLFHLFCDRRCDESWSEERHAIADWLGGSKAKPSRAAA